MTPGESGTTTPTVAMIGNPNTGKSTLFSALAGLSTRIGNYPGVTVEKKIGRVRWGTQSVELVDLPGTYSLAPRTLDEMVSVDLLLGRQPGMRRPDAVVCIADASNLERNLYLLSQVLDLDCPVLLVLNMWDTAMRRGISIDPEALSRRLGVTVVVTEAHRGRGVEDVRRALMRIIDQPPRPVEPLFPPEFYAARSELVEKLEACGSALPPHYLLDRLLLDVGGYIESYFARRCADNLPAFLLELRGRLGSNGCPVPATEAHVRYDWARRTLAGVVTRPRQSRVSTSSRIDRLLTHSVAGLAIFAALMFVVFQTIYTWAIPFMEAIETGQQGVASWVAQGVAPGPLRSLLIDGVIAGVGGVIVFLPQIVLLFLFLAVLEDCGYMARAAFLMDKLMTRVGLSGKSFVPLMSSFACAVPGVMATRVIENHRDRMVTMLVAPLMSCSARLPVYLLLIAAFVPATAYVNGWVTLQGLVLFGMSSLGAAVAIPVAWIMKKTFFRGETPPFVMELPPYKWPSARVVAWRVYDRARAFVVRAGTLIFATTVLVWAAGYFPGDRGALHRLETRIDRLESQPNGKSDREVVLADLHRQHNVLSARLMKGSLLGQLGQAVEPVARPLGWDWRIAVGTIASFPAREVIIATLGTIYSLGGDVDEQDTGLIQAMQSATWPDGTKVYNVPVALSLMVFFALCAQCAATLMTIRRETNSWRWPAFTFVYMTLLAYVGALVTYQVAIRLA